MTAEAKKAWLRRYKNQVLKIDRLNRKLDNINDKLGVRSHKISGMPKGSGYHTMDDLIADKADIEKRIARLEIKAREIKTEITLAIDEVDHFNAHEVLEGLFVDLCPIDKLSEDMGYTLRHLQKIYAKGIALINIPDADQT